MEDNLKNFNQEILDKIKEQKITPTPKWHFLLKNYVIWFFGALSLVLGAVAVSLIIHMVRFDDFAALRYGGAFWGQKILLVIPFFWLVCLSLFMVLVYLNIKHTKKGYKYSPVLVLISAIAASAVFGVIFHVVGWSQRFDDAASRRMPFYREIINPHMSFWSSPEEGRLSGVVMSVNDDSDFSLVDMGKQEWTVDITSAKNKEEDVVVGHPIRVVGQKTADNGFIADMILTMRSGRGFFEDMASPMMIDKDDSGFMPGRGQDDGIMKPGEKGGKPAKSDCNCSAGVVNSRLQAIINSAVMQNKSEINNLIDQDPQIIFQLKIMGVDTNILGRTK